MGRLRDGRARFPLLQVLLQVVDVLPSQTATVEWGFSLLVESSEGQEACGS